MTVTSSVLFNTPRKEIASLLNARLNACTSASLIAGFMTVEGIQSLIGPIQANLAKLQTLVVGAATYRALDAFDRLLALGVQPDRLRVHLGHTRLTRPGAAHPFYRYHPMLHSKVYLFDLPDEQSAAFVGSHNLTGFALQGQNGEAGVLLEGPSGAPQFRDIRAHIKAASDEAVEYDPLSRDAYGWWTEQYAEGWKDKLSDAPKDGQGKKTIVILTAMASQGIPTKDDIIYFELPAALKTRAIGSEVHVYIFDVLPGTPAEALGELGNARTSLWCTIEGIEDDQGGLELQANWHLDNQVRPTLRPTSRPFRPRPAPSMQQVRAKVWNKVAGKFEYLFTRGKANFEPVLDEETSIQADSESRDMLERLDIVPPEHLPWFRVSALVPKEKGDTAFDTALRATSPQTGSFVLFSLRRRELEPQRRGKRK